MAAEPTGDRNPSVHDELQALSAEIGRKRARGENVNGLIARHRELCSRAKADVPAPASAPQRDRMTVSICDDERSFAALRDEWDELIEDSDTYSPFLTWEWLYPWWEVFGTGCKLRIILVRSPQGRLVGIAPLMIARTRGRCLKFIGVSCNPPRANYLGLIVHRDYATDVPSVLVESLMGVLAECDYGLLSHVALPDGGQRLIEALTTFASRPGAPLFMVEHEIECIYDDLPDSYEAFAAGAPSKRRRTYLRTQLQRLYKEYPSAELIEVTTQDQMQGALTALARMSIERRRAKGEISTFVSSRNMAFRKQSHELFRQKGWLRLDELRVDGQTIAVLLGFEFGGAYFGNQLSFDANFASVRPVHCLLANRIRRLIADGVRRFDFLCGDLQYKREYFAQSKPELHLWLFPRTVRGMICAMRFSGRRLLAAAKRTWLSRRSEPHGKTNPRETAGDGAGGQPAVSSREAGSEHPTRSSERSGIRPAVVICAPDGSVPTALGVIRCLGRAGVPVTVIASPGSPFARSRYATEVVGLTPRELADPASLLACLTTIAREFDEPRPLFVASDRNAQFVHDHWDRLRDGYLYPLLAPESLHTCLDKRLTAETAHRAGVAAPRTRFCDANADIDSVIDDMSYPCVVKPASQALVELLEKINCPPNMHGKTWRAADHAALDGILRTTQAAGMPVVIQAEVGTPDTPILSCSVAVAQSGEMLACWTGVKLRKLPLLCGTATLAESRWMPELVGPAQHVVQAFGLRGVCEIEFAVDPATGAPMLIEVNPRSWVWVALAQRSGANLPFATYCDLTGHPSSRSAERDGLLWVSLWHDWTAYRRSSGTRGIRRLLLPLGYAASFRRWPEFAYFTCDDTVPGLIGAARFVTQDMRHKLIDSQAGVR